MLSGRLSRLLGGLLRSDAADEIGDDGSASMDAPDNAMKTRRTRPTERRLGNSVAAAELSELLYGKGSPPKSDAALNKAYRECDFRILEKDASSADILARLAQNRLHCPLALIDDTWNLDR